MRLQATLSTLLLLLVASLNRADELQDSLNYVTKECKSKLLNIQTLNDFKEFMINFRSVIGSTEKPKKGFLQSEKNLRKCLDQKEQLLQLEQIILHQEEGVCHLNYINKLVDYHLSNVIKNKKKDDSDPEAALSQRDVRRKTFAAYIFSLFAHQVVYTCKSKLLERVPVLESRFECGEVLSSFLPVDIAKSQSADDETSFRFNEFLQNFKRVEDFSLMFDRSSDMMPYYNVLVPAEISSKIATLKDLCKVREAYYKTLFLPVSALSQLGYDVENTLVDSHDLNSPEQKTLKCWLATAQLCQGILRVHAEHAVDEDGDDSAGKFVEINFGNAPADVISTSIEQTPEAMEFHDVVDHINVDIVQLVNKKKSLASRLKRNFSFAKKYLIDHVKVDESQNQMLGLFFSALIRSDNDLDSAVAFNGKQENPGLYTPTRMIADDTDTILMGASYLVSRKFALVLNSCVAIGLTTAFIVFTVVSSAFAAKQSLSEPGKEMASGNFKEYYRKKFEERMKSSEEKIQRRGWNKKIVGTVYVGRKKG